MKCVDCGSKMKSATENYRYDECGLPYVVLECMEVSRCPKCGAKEVAVPALEGLHSLIAHVVANKGTRLMPAEVRYLRKYLGFSSGDFAEIVGVEAETVSRWENGAQPPNPVADRLIRVLALGTRPAKGYPIDHAAILDNLRKIDETTSEPARVEAIKREGKAWEPVGI